MFLTNVHRESRLILRKCSLKSFMPICLYIGLFTLLIQVCIFLSILFIFEDDFEWKVFTSMSKTLSSNKLVKSSDFGTLLNIFYNLGIKVIALDKVILLQENITRSRSSHSIPRCIICNDFDNTPIVLGVSSGILLNEARDQLFELLQNAQFVFNTFYNTNPVQAVPDLADVPIGYIIQRTSLFQLVILHAREDNTWWFGDLHSDVRNHSKLAKFGLEINNLQIMQHEGSIEKFELVPSAIEDNGNIFFPKDISKLLTDLNNSKFIECNISRAEMFHKQYHRDISATATRFRHRAWKLLARAKTVLDSFGILFWISSGTCLGYHRECDIIAHSTDVDIGLWAETYTSDIITEMKNHGFSLKIWLGRPNDSLELSFVDQSGIKLDMFFFYKEGKNVWNGGTQVKSAKKFKYIFPKFELCWTLFQDLKVRVPCDTDTYIRANYGPNWFQPVTSWDWKTSPHNVRPNGKWKQEELREVIKVFP